VNVKVRQGKTVVHLVIHLNSIFSCVNLRISDIECLFRIVRFDISGFSTRL